MAIEQTLSQLRERFGKMLPAAPAAVMDAYINFQKDGAAAPKASPCARTAMKLGAIAGGNA